MPKKPISPYKLASLPEWQQRDIQKREAKQQATLRRGTSLKQKPGAKRLQQTRKVKGKVIKRLTQHTGLNPSGKPLRSVGVRGRRLEPKDKAARAEITGQPCCCGCNRLSAWVHLKTRGSEALRHLDWVTIPGCVDLDYWLDQGPGAAVKAELFELAESLQRRLTEADITKTLSDNGYYTWLYDKRTII